MGRLTAPVCRRKSALQLTIYNQELRWPPLSPSSVTDILQPRTFANKGNKGRLLYLAQRLDGFWDEHQRVNERAQVPATGLDISTRSDPPSRDDRYRGRVSVGSLGGGLIGVIG